LKKTPNTIADGLKANLGSITFPILKNNVDRIFTVSEQEIVQAMRIVWERMKIVIEPSSAVPVAVVLFSKEFKQLDNMKNIVIVLSGGNVNFPFTWERLAY